MPSMKPAAFLVSCAFHGINLSVEGDRIAASGKVSPRITAYIDRYQSELAVLLGSELLPILDTVPDTVAVNEFNVFNTAENTAESIESTESLCPSALAICDTWDWKQIGGYLCSTTNYVHTDCMAKQLRLSLSMCRNALAYLAMRGLCDASTVSAKDCWYKQARQPELHTAPTDYYRARLGVGLSDLSPLMEEMDSATLATPVSPYTINAPAGDTGHCQQKGLF